jgi:hypothetical protein
MEKAKNNKPLEERIFSFIKGRENVSLAELENHIDGFKGNYEWVQGENKIVWRGMSKKAIEALRHLLKKKKIYIYATTPLVYYIEGLVPDLPVVKQPNRDYKNRHWLPVVFCTDLKKD